MKTNYIKTICSIIALVTISVVSILGTITPGNSAMTKWHDLGGGKVRMVTNYHPIKNLVEGIVEVQLKPGWTTYWRNPGESGIPPTFNFSASKGLSASAPLFPLPKVKTYQGIVSVIYQDNVSFPFQAKPMTSPLSGELKLELAIGVCAEICIPAVATLVQKMDGLNQSDISAANLISAALKNIPLKDTDNGMSIQKVNFDGNNKIRVLVTTTSQNDHLELLAEGKPNWYIAPGKIISENFGKTIFEIDTSTIPSTSKITDVPMRLTLTTGKMGIEKTIDLSNNQ